MNAARLQRRLRLPPAAARIRSQRIPSIPVPITVPLCFRAFQCAQAPLRPRGLITEVTGASSSWPHHTRHACLYHHASSVEMLKNTVASDYDVSTPFHFDEGSCRPRWATLCPAAARHARSGVGEVKLVVASDCRAPAGRVGPSHASARQDIFPWAAPGTSRPTVSHRCPPPRMAQYLPSCRALPALAAYVESHRLSR